MGTILIQTLSIIVGLGILFTAPVWLNECTNKIKILLTFLFLLALSSAITSAMLRNKEADEKLATCHERPECIFMQVNTLEVCEEGRCRKVRELGRKILPDWIE